MNNLAKKYDKNNWFTWKELLSKHYQEEVVNKCDSCHYAMSDNAYSICAATYYGKKITSISHRKKEDCDYAIDFALYVELGESRIDEQFNKYIGGPD